MIPIDKDVIGYISVALAIGNTVPYCMWILRGTIKPHMFSWIIWTLEMGIAAAGQSAEAAGPGAWALWTGAVGNGIIALLACFRGEHKITKSDIVTFLAALSAIPLWQLTNNPFLAIVIVSIIDTLGYYPTMRKSYANPYQESASLYVVSTGTLILALSATTTYSLQTMLYPIMMLINNIVLLAIIFHRRHALQKVPVE